MWLIFLRRCFVLSWTHQSPAESPPVISLWVGTGEDVSFELALFRKPSKKHKLMMAELARMLRPSRAHGHKISRGGQKPGCSPSKPEPQGHSVLRGLYPKPHFW